MLKGLLGRITGRRNAAAVERAVEEGQMSPAEREFVEESAEDHMADAESEAHLGGIDPNRLLDD